MYRRCFIKKSALGAAAIATPDTLTANIAFAKAPVVWQHRIWGTGDGTTS